MTDPAVATPSGDFRAAGRALDERDHGFFGHPRGLSTLFFTEMWERFSYYGMRAFLILYMVAPAAAGGLGFTDARAASIYGTYTGSAWAASIVGGLIADRLLGQYRTVLIGGIIIAAGHFTLAFKPLPSFYAGLALIVMGTGCLKPNVSTLVGSLYEPGDSRRDAGFSLFYMGINLGAFIGPLIAGYLAQRVNWHLGFACAGVGMTLGLIQYIIGRRRLESAIARLETKPASFGDLSAQPARSVPQAKPNGAKPPDTTTDANERERVSHASGAGIAGVPASERAGGFGGAKPPDTTTEKKRIAAIVFFFLAAVIFWGAYEQAGSTLNLFADRYTRLEVFSFTFPSSWFQSVQPIFVILLAPAFAWLLLRLGRHEPSVPAKS